MLRNFTGELIGTFILVFMGCGSVGIAIVYENLSLYEIAFVWCLAVTFGIYASRSMSDAHLNPAVSVAMLAAKKLELRLFLPYLAGQFIGAFAAAGVLFLLFNPGLTAVEELNAVSRETVDAVITAKMFGEYYSFGGSSGNGISTLNACFAEAGGTFFLVFMIFRLTTKKRTHKYLTPFFIGLVVATVICVIAPLTQAGINPARDLGPRVFSYLAGWKGVAFSAANLGWLLVYVIAPIIGAIGAHFVNGLIAKKTQPVPQGNTNTN